MKKKILATMALLIGLSLVVYSGVKPSAAASPERWEYTAFVEEYPYEGGPTDTPLVKQETVNSLNKLGAEGWELVSTTGPGGSRHMTAYYFKRKLP